jgi:uncharacterized repeat protein (TIGR04042 family)
MPEMEFRLRWPDGSESSFYSPSLVVEDHLTVGKDYLLTDLVARACVAMTIASDRVQAKYGFPCSRAQGTLAAIERQAKVFGPHSTITVTGFRRLDGAQQP